MSAAWDKKARDIVILDVGSINDVTDFIVICSADSDRGVKTIADNIGKKLKEMGMRPLGIEGYTHARWVLIDSGDVVVHVFHEPVRELFDIEGLWIDAPRVKIPFLPEIAHERQGVAEDRV
ncbi:MAG: ribosome silencing factor [Thermodesulfobacteriota bacterium]